MGPVPETRYTRSGEVHIAYQVVGDGPLDLVFVPGYVSHLEHDWEGPWTARFFSTLGPGSIRPVPGGRECGVATGWAGRSDRSCR